jgi:MFS family permease
MSLRKRIAQELADWRPFFFHRSTGSGFHHLYPQRWNWSTIVRPLDRHLKAHIDSSLVPAQIFNLRYFWLDGVLAALSENFYLGFLPLFALALGATNGQVGWLTAVANLTGAIAFLPGARLAERGSRKLVVLWSGGGIARLMLLAMALLPVLSDKGWLLIWLLIGLNGLRAFMSNLGNPAWTAIVADLVPDYVRGRYFSDRNIAMGLAALAATPLAGYLINLGNGRFGLTEFGYQFVLIMAFAFGMVSTFSYSRIREPVRTRSAVVKHHPGDLWRTVKQSPGFTGLVVSAFIWNLALQVAAPFFNVYLVNNFQASTTTIGLLVSISSLMALFGQRYFGRLVDIKGTFWVMMVCGFIIPLLPLGWVFITAPWHVGLINTLGGFVWAGYNLANFNMLLLLTPDKDRPRAVALYQTAVFTSAFIGPLIGGHLADVASFKLIFGLSFAGRASAMILFYLFVIRRVFPSGREKRIAS